MDPTQILLFAVVSVLTVLLVAIGIQVFFILKEAKRALAKVNKILEDASLVSSSVAKPIVGVASFIEGVRGLKEKEGQEAPEHGHIEALQERGRRFFHRDGKPLTS